MWVSNISVCSFAWWNNISAIWARLVVKHAIHISIVNVVEYRSMSRSMLSANLKTGTLSITTMLSWTWSMSSTTWWNQICHTTTRGWCTARYMIVSSNVAKSFKNRPESRFWVRQCHVQSHRKAGKPATWQKCASLCKTFWRALSRGVIRFSTRCLCATWSRAFGNPPKNPEMLRKTLKILQNFTISDN